MKKREPANRSRNRSPSRLRRFLTPRDKKILIAYYETGANDAELAAVFGPDAPARVAQISDGVGKLLRLFKRLERNETGDFAEEAARC